MQVPYILSGDGNLNLVFAGRQYQVKPQDPNYTTIREVVEEKLQCDDETFAQLLNPEKQVASHLSKQINTRLKIENGLVTYDGYEVHGVLIDRLLEFAAKGINTKPLENFLVNLMENPSRSSSERLYGFLEHKNLPLTPDGCFLAYKAVTWDYKSKTAGPTGPLDNHVGTVVEVPRNRVDDNHLKDCSYGLHAGNLEYVQGFGSFNNENPDRIVIVKINPRDVVSVPDYHTDKLRTCRYEVVQDYCQPLTEPVHKENQEPWYDEGREEDDEYDDSDLEDDEYDDYDGDEEEEDYDEEDDDDDDDPNVTKKSFFPFPW